MKKLLSVSRRLYREESGHVEVGVPSLAAAIGAIVLGIGAASDSDIASIAGGVVLGLGLFLAGVARHRGMDYEMYSRIDALEKK